MNNFKNTFDVDVRVAFLGTASTNEIISKHFNDRFFAFQFTEMVKNRTKNGAD